MTPVPWTPEDDEARRILTERVDSYDVDPADITWWERLIGWLNDALSLNVNASGAGSIIIQVLLVIAVAAVVFLLVRYFRPGLAASEHDDVPHLADPNLSAAQYWQSAQQHLAAERFAPAYLDAFRYLVRYATEHQLVEVTPSTTATTFCWSLGAVMPADRDALDAAATEFNAMSYGDWMPNRAQTHAMLQLAQRIATAQPQPDPTRLMPR